MILIVWKPRARGGCVQLQCNKEVKTIQELDGVLSYENFTDHDPVVIKFEVDGIRCQS